MSFAEMVTSSVFARALGLILVAITCLAAILIMTLDLALARDVPAVVWVILGTGLGTGGTLTSINYGVNLQPMTAKKVSSSLPPTP